jgi:hypothetical protein
MVAKRLAALIAAVALIVGAVALRRSLDNKSSASPAAPGATPASTGPRSPSAPVTIVCITELAAACDAARASGAATSVAPYADTLSAIGEGAIPAVWVTLAPIDRMAVDAANQRVYGDAPSPLASSPLVIAAATDRATALVTACGGTIGWKCIGENSTKAWTDLGGQASWGRLLAGHADPSKSATGLLTLGAAAAGYFGNTSFNQAEMNGDGDFGLWFGRLESKMPAGVFSLASPLDAMIGRKLVGVVGTTDADVAQRTGAQRSALTTTPSGAVAIAVVAVTEGNQLDDSTLAAMGTALADAGWSAAPPDPTANGLPSPGALRTLRDNWSNL